MLHLPNGHHFIGESLEIKKIFKIIEKLSPLDTTVLIRGESGTGKELVAQALHFNSPRRIKQFVTINCSAIPENLIESEFFGYEKGAFTGAESKKIGKFHYADQGTLFLDEIGDISPSMQVKLLRVLQEKCFIPLGTNQEVKVNLRIIAATNRNLEEKIQTGSFREDLFYRLNIFPIYLPPLRERKSDIESLIAYFIEKLNSKYQKKITNITTNALKCIENHCWNGNIRELANAIEHAFLLEPTSEITLSSLPGSLVQKADQKEKTHTFAFLDTEWDCLDYHTNKAEFEKQFLVRALKAFKGKINQTSRHAKISKKTLLRKLEKYGIKARHYT